MYIECKAGTLNGPACIGLVTFSKTGRTLMYRGLKLKKSKSGYKWNHYDQETGDHYWISAPRRDARDRLYPQSTQGVAVDEDVWFEYWTESVVSLSLKC